MKRSAFLLCEVCVCLQTPCDYKRFRKGKWGNKNHRMASVYRVDMSYALQSGKVTNHCIYNGS